MRRHQQDVESNRKPYVLIVSYDTTQNVPTNVFPVESKKLSELLQARPSRNNSGEMVAELYWPEGSRQSEPDTLEEVYRIAKREGDVVDGHVPEMVWFHKFDDTSTVNIRKALGVGNAELDSHVLYIIVFRKLHPITELSGQEFLSAWWQAILCHRALWESGMRHWDISSTNLMYYRVANMVIGVLNDYDLSSIQNTPTGYERTGTVPFMVMDLLMKQAIEGNVEHLYRHDAESLIWVLTRICLRYENGKLKGGMLNDWLKVDALKEKSSFLMTGRKDPELQPSSSHEDSWQIAQKCLSAIASFYALHPTPVVENGEIFRTWLQSSLTV